MSSEAYKKILKHCNAHEFLNCNVQGVEIAMNVSGILERVFNKIPKEHVANIIAFKRPGWEPEKKELQEK